MFIPTYNKRTNALLALVEKRMRSYLSGRRINITLTFMSSSSYLVHAISCSNNTAKISPFVMFIIFFFFWFPLFIFIFLFFTAWPTTRHALPVTRNPLPATRHPSPAEKSCRLLFWSETVPFVCKTENESQTRPIIACFFVWLHHFCFFSKIRTLLWVTVNKTWKYSRLPRLPITQTFKGNRKKVWVNWSLSYWEFQENSRE